MKKVLVTGANGQLGQCLQDAVLNKKDLQVLFKDLPNLDITNLKSLETFFSKNKFEYCINCAAYTSVDLAETNKELAYAVNAVGVKNLAEVCKKNKITLLHISTDFVFDGQKEMPYTEDDTPNPLGVYGNSKLQGERYIQEAMDCFFIIRTSWLYSEYGNNFLKTMLKLSETRDKISVVNDQIGSPTYAGDLAQVLLKIVLSSSKNYGLYHYSNYGAISWYDFAVEIFKRFDKTTEVVPIQTSGYPTAAQRPKYSVLSTKKIENEIKISTPTWRCSLQNLSTPK